MLSLTAQQLNLVRLATAMVPQPDRDNFVRSVAGRLSAYPHQALEHALAFVLQGRDISVTATYLRSVANCKPKGDNYVIHRRRRLRSQPAR
jgi:hypothetical protein